MRNVCVVGLGYVGLPLAAAFARHRETLGFDVDASRIEELSKGHDRNNEVSAEALMIPKLVVTSDPATLVDRDVFIIAVPTPVDRTKRPDLRHLLSASRLVGQALATRAASGRSAPTPIVVFESTVYPGCTEEVCAPEIVTSSELPRSAFRLGYSPERINPGDSQHTLERVVKVVSAEDPETLDAIAALYEEVVKAGIHRAPDIRTAEAAKVIENTQRDINIALMNECALIFHRMGIDTRAVLAAARTKWNFLPFEPGLVGGHCIPEDPYYLTHKAVELGYHPEVILAGRRINDRMGVYVADETLKKLARAGVALRGAKILILGVTFKENVPDVRNTRVADVARELASYGCEVAAHDPVVGDSGVRRLGLTPAAAPFARGGFDAVVIAVPHTEFRERPFTDFVGALARGEDGVLIDVRGAFAEAARATPLHYWSL